MHAGKGNFLGKDDCDSTLFINILYGRQGSLYNTEHMLCVRRELLEGQDLHMEAKETEELLDWIAAEAGLDEVSLYTCLVMVMIMFCWVMVMFCWVMVMFCEHAVGHGRLLGPWACVGS